MEMRPEIAEHDDLVHSASRDLRKRTARKTLSEREIAATRGAGNDVVQIFLSGLIERTRGAHTARERTPSPHPRRRERWLPFPRGGRRRASEGAVRASPLR